MSSGKYRLQVLLTEALEFGCTYSLTRGSLLPDVLMQLPERLWESLGSLVIYFPMQKREKDLVQDVLVCNLTRNLPELMQEPGASQ